MPIVNYYIDSKRIRKLMIDKGIDKVTELSKASGVDRNTLTYVLSGKIKPSSTVMYKLKETLGMSAATAGEIFFADNLRNT